MSKIFAAGLVLAAGLCVAASCAKSAELSIVVQHRPVAWDWHLHPAIQQVPQPTSEAGIRAQLDEDRKWEAYCRPVRNRDDLGVTRLTYAHRGCEFGRSED